MGERDSLHKAVDNTLELAADKSYKSVAIPALFAGIYQFPMKLATSVIVNAIQKYWFMKNTKQTTLRVVYLCGLDETTTEAFCGALQIISGGKFFTHEDAKSFSDFEPENEEPEMREYIH